VREGLTRPLWLATVIAAFCVPLFIGLGRTDLENDEAIYSFAVDKIIETGDWLNPPLSPHNEATFLEKPPLKFWIVAAPIALGLLPHNEVGLRVWDALFGGVAFLYVFAFGRRLAGPICGLIALLVLFLYQPLLFNHGLRQNNMEAPLVLCYCGAIYHYLAWLTTERAPRRRWHVLAICAYFFLGFMTKFVASFFLPIILAVAWVTDRAARQRLREDVRHWLIGAAAFLALASPWFIYQMTREGMGVWRVMISEHVYLRFTGSLDVSHIKPWSFYFTTLYEELERSGTVWLCLAGAVVLLVHTVRERRREQILVLSWFFVPMALMSIGTSKLQHYAYPFLPPIALAAGYGPAWILRAGRRYVESGMEILQRRIGGVQWRSGVRYALLALATIAVALSIVTFVVGQVVWRVGDVQIFRNSHVARPLAVAVVLAILAGRGMLAARLLWPVALLLAVIPVNAYENVWKRTFVEEHPLRTARDCLQRARETELAAGRSAPPPYAIGEHRWFLHSYYYYLHRAGGWERAETFNQRAVDAGLLAPGQQRPIMMEEETYRALKERYREVIVPRVPFGRMLLLTPGPYAPCGLTVDQPTIQ
jgi:4-amino-4-deoxy-L-arabinose transferase-like glycosyltransferase